jgi:phage terminase large subunit
LDDVEKLKSITPAKGVFTDVWIEEATETELSSLKQLEKRQRGGDESTPKRIVLTFNPVLRSHWIYKQYFENLAWEDTQREYRSDNLTILKTTYKDNRFLTLQDIERLENESDPYYHDVYTLGNWGVLGNVIFTNWRVEDLSGIRNQFVNRRCGIDFGFAGDPAAAPLTHYDKAHKTIYWFDELYETGLTNDVLADRLKTMDGNAYWKADSAEPKSIAELQKYGVYVQPAAKGKDSVVHGIQWLQQQTIILDKKCINARNEFAGYKWKEDAGGQALPIPVDKNNHFIDQLRYAYEDEMIGEVGSIPNPFYN